MKPGAWIVVGMLAVGAAGVAGRCSAPHGISPADAAELARRGGDSAVASYRKDVAAVIGRLEDSVAHYRGRATAGAKIVVRRAVLTRADTAAIVAAAGRDGGPPDTADVALEEVRERGITVAETLAVAPPPAFLARRLAIAFEPDTFLVAFLRTPEGLTRVTAAATTAGVNLAVADAAAEAPPEERRGPGFWDWLNAASCAAAGWAAAKEAVGPALGAGGACAVLLWRPRLDLWPF